MRPSCKNCKNSAYNYDMSNPKGYMRDYICGNGKYSGTPVYPWECCSDYAKRWKNNKQVDFQDLKENGYGELDTM